MRRPTTTLGTLAAAATLTLGLGGSAYASSGDLVINGHPVHEPSGCVMHDGPAVIANHTDKPVLITAGRWCTGPVVGSIHPGETRFGPFTSNLYAT
ncbi:hypothetical protein ACFWCB_02410 [Streptomyces sp. NPDC060048]|uniref:hypothetical protein n=1 Tax=unclassified Streptomyces TaxID=2593676 RepID=UPI00369D94BC